jgi:two-component system chemotaxis response regulator CheY
MKKLNTIFVIDDDLVFHFIIKKLFLKFNVQFNTNYFLNGFEAIEELKKNVVVPDLIFLDINMPIYDGWQFLDEFKKLKKSFNKEIEIYLISSSDDVTDIKKASKYQDEIKGFCNKPITFDEFQKIFKDF